jgi:hypothetical protein
MMAEPRQVQAGIRNHGASVDDEGIVAGAPNFLGIFVRSLEDDRSCAKTHGRLHFSSFDCESLNWRSMVDSHRPCFRRLVISSILPAVRVKSARTSYYHISEKVRNAILIHRSY